MSTVLLVLVAILYLVVAGLVMLIARVCDDPYGHFSPGRDWLQAILMGALWPLALAYLVCAAIYYSRR